MASLKSPKVALLFAQFSAYHVDRCQAVARRFAGRAELLAVEVATRSTTYAWEASGDVSGAKKVTLFPGANYDEIGTMRRFWHQFRTLWRCRVVLVGIGYNQRDVILLSWALALVGVRVILLSESKFDDKPRSIWMEWAKALALSPYCAAIVGGHRHMAYFRFLGFRLRPVVPGYDTVGIDRVRAMADSQANAGATPYSERNFVFVGRFVGKKNLSELVNGFALYAKSAGKKARRLVLIGSGEEEPAVRALAASLGILALIDFPGFLNAEEVASQLSGGLALVLVSSEEQWGLVVNEALAFGLPLIVSPAVGSGDLLVRNLVNGFVVEYGSPEGIARAMAVLAGSEESWERMVSASHSRAWLGDTERLADAVQALVEPENVEAAKRLLETTQFLACPPAQR